MRLIKSNNVKVEYNMKYSLKATIYIILIIIITLICCILFIKPRIFNFRLTKEYEYIQNNRKYIEKIIIRTKAQLGESCYKLDVKKGYDILDNIDIKKETKFWCSDSDKYLEFYFKDGTYKGIHFQCENLVYDGINYELKDKVILVDKDVYIPDKITKGMIIVSDEDKIDCK